MATSGYGATPSSIMTDEVFYCLFANHPFLVRFNNIVAALIKNENEERDFDFPKESIDKNGIIKRCAIPQWAKLAVFHRDHGRCVFCGKDLTNVYIPIQMLLIMTILCH